jgi:hypothetical protein
VNDFLKKSKQRRIGGFMKPESPISARADRNQTTYASDMMAFDA